MTSNLEKKSQLSFEAYYVYVAQKLKNLGFLIELFFTWTFITLATSWGPNFNLSNLNRVSNFSWRCHKILFVCQDWKLDGFRLHSPKWIHSAHPPPWVINWPKSPGFLADSFFRVKQKSRITLTSMVCNLTYVFLRSDTLISSFLEVSTSLNFAPNHSDCIFMKQ